MPPSEAHTIQNHFCCSQAQGDAVTILKSPLSVSANTALKVKTYMCDFVTLKIFHCEDDPVCLSSLAPPSRPLLFNPSQSSFECITLSHSQRSLSLILFFVACFTINLVYLAKHNSANKSVASSVLVISECALFMPLIFGFSCKSLS